jgi:hypothetical protein
MPEFEFDLVTLFGLIIVVVFGLGGVIIGFLGLRQGSRSNIRDIISKQIAEFPSFKTAMSEQISKSYRDVESRIRDFGTPRNEFKDWTSQLERAQEQLRFQKAEVQELREQVTGIRATIGSHDIIDVANLHNAQLEELLTSKQGKEVIERMTQLEMLLEVEIERAAHAAVADPSFVDELAKDKKDAEEWSKQTNKILSGKKNDKFFSGIINKVKSIINKYISRKSHSLSE